MERPSKKDIKAAVDRLKANDASADIPQQAAPQLQAKKTNKNRIRKQGV